MNEIDSYIIENRKIGFFIKVFIIISIIIFVSLIILSGLRYKKYYQTIGIVIRDENKYKLTLYLDPYKLKIIKNNNVLIIDDLEYKYTINYINNEYVISNNYTNYLNVVLDIELKKEDKIENNILQVKVLESNKKIFYYLKDYLKKGASEWKK